MTRTRRSISWNILQRRIGEPDDIAVGNLIPASDAALHIHGETLHVDGPCARGCKALGDQPPFGQMSFGQLNCFVQRFPK